MITDNESTEFEPTSDDHFEDAEIVDVEENAAGKLKQLREKLKVADTEKKQYLEDLQRAKADFLNTKKRLDEEQMKLKQQITNAHITDLLPLCDSFVMAMSNRAVWEAVDNTWRSGVEGIYAQLQTILEAHNVTAVDPTGDTFDPERHEALSNEVVTDKKQHGKIQSVIQLGYERTIDGTTILIRPARVIVGNYEEKQ